jgi:hypothetical protein
MPLSTQTLAGETAATFFIHAVAVFAVGLGIMTLNVDITSSKLSLIPWIILFAVISYLIHMGFLAQLQIEGCSGITDLGAVALGALKALAITLPFAAAPLFSEWIRLLISQVIIRHLPLAVPAQVAINETTVRAADTVEGLATGRPPLEAGLESVGIGGVLAQPDYDKQTAKELGWACAYMAAFGGAIGFATGSWGVTNCRGKGSRRV